MLNFLNLFKKKQYKIQSFTYFIPAPKQFQKGYREKQFDQLFYEFINKGFEVISFDTQSISTGELSGMWVIIIVRATNQEAEKFDLQFPDNFLEAKGPKMAPSGEIELTHDDKNSKIDGIYYIED